MSSRMRTPERALNLLLIAAISGAMLGEPAVLCIEPDGRSHRESFTEDCCFLGDVSVALDMGAGYQAADAADCGDCRDILVAAKLAFRLLDRSTFVRTPVSSLSQVDSSEDLTTFRFVNRSPDRFVAPILLALRTVVISC